MSDLLFEVKDQIVTITLNRPQQPIRMMKRAVYQGLNMELRTSLDMISSAMGLVTELPDYQEGICAIIEKRKPEFE